jgi:predicted aspartyl protease
VQDKSKVKTPVVSVKVNGSTVDMIVDAGASTDILDEFTYGKVHLKNIQLQAATKRLFSVTTQSDRQI